MTAKNSMKKKTGKPAGTPKLYGKEMVKDHNVKSGVVSASSNKPHASASGDGSTTPKRGEMSKPMPKMGKPKAAMAKKEHMGTGKMAAPKGMKPKKKK
jgi:hypothetical protein